MNTNELCLGAIVECRIYIWCINGVVKDIVDNGVIVYPHDFYPFKDLVCRLG